MSKIQHDITQALDCIKSGDTVLVGGFGLIGAPLTLIDGLTERDVNELTIVSNNLGESGKGLGILLNQNKIKKGIGRSEEHTSELQSRENLVCRLLLEKKKYANI